METSDSEYFESADEDFQSDEENTETVKRVGKNSEVEKIDEVVRNVGNLQIFKDENMNKDDQGDAERSLDNKCEDKNVYLECKKTEVNMENSNVTNEKIVESLKVEGLDHPGLDNVIEDTNINVEYKVTKNVNIVKKDEENIKKTVKESKIGSKISNKKKNTKPSSDIDTKIIEEHKIATPETIKPSIEENLWEDDEIDWAKEEELSKNTPENSKITPDLRKNTQFTPNTQNCEPESSNLWENDDWESIEAPSKDSTKITQEKDSGWSNWGTWGVSSILNTATASVSTLTTHVSQGISTVLESGIGVPDPEELARQHKEHEDEIIKNVKNIEDFKNVVETSQGNPLGGFGLGNLVSGVSQLTKLVESTGTKVISGGLDTLETIGKKTMEVLQEGDPGLKKKRAFLKLDQNKPILSQVLREAKEKSNEDNKNLNERNFLKTKNYETLFDDHQGLVHLEALEMLSKQCDIKLETLSENFAGDDLVEMQETLEQVKELCELPEEDEDELLTIPEIKEKINNAVSEINIKISYEKLEKTWDDTESWLETLKLNLVDEKELHQQAIETLAQLTAISVEQFHKTAELLLVKENRSTADEADSLVQLTTSLIALIGIVAAKFSDKLNSKTPMVNNKESVNELITNVFLEASNSSSYIQDAFQLLIPVLQVGAV